MKVILEFINGKEKIIEIGDIEILSRVVYPLPYGDILKFTEFEFCSKNAEGYPVYR